MHLFSFSLFSSIPVLGNGLYYKNHKIGQVLAVWVGRIRSALLHHGHNGHLEWTPDGCGDQCHSGQSRYLMIPRLVPGIQDSDIKDHSQLEIMSI